LEAHMGRKLLVASLWIASLFAVAYWRDLEPRALAQAPLPRSYNLQIHDVAQTGHYRLIATSTGDCYLQLTVGNQVLMSPAKCP